MNEMERLSLPIIKDALQNDSLILFVGAGVSVNSGLPGWNSLVDLFRKELNLEEVQDNLRVAQYYYNAFGQNQYLKKIEEVFSKIYLPNELHSLIEQLSPKHIITTNYDTLLEDQFNDSILKYNVISSDNDIPYSTSGHYLVKMHGDFTKKNIVLKEDDYFNYEKNFPMMSTLIQSLIMNHIVLFVGYSLGDSTFNSIFRLIQDRFKDDAKRAFFYTTDNVSEIEQDYYRRKGINVIVGDFAEELENKDNKNSKFNRTKKFLENILEDDYIVDTSEKLWKNISFLDKLSFVEASTIKKYAKLKDKAILMNNSLSWVKDDEGFSVANNENIIDFIMTKTTIGKFLDFEESAPRELNRNEGLSQAFELYCQKKFSLAKAKFREIANKAFKRKDYFNFLLCEFNFLHIGEFVAEKKEDYIQPAYNGEFEKIVEELALATSGEEKEIIVYFRDNILNFMFACRKLEKIDKYLDNIREENHLYKNNGWTANNNLFNIRQEIIDFKLFIENNCICISQYSIYKDIINKYFEALLICLDNDKIEIGESGLFIDQKSSTLVNLGKEDLETVLPYINIKRIPVILDSCSYSKISISENAEKYIFDEINNQITSNHDIPVYMNNLLKNSLKMLRYFTITKPESVIDILNKVPIKESFTDEIRNCLIILLDNVGSLKKEQISELGEIIVRHINYISSNKLELVTRNYRYYSALWNNLKIDANMIIDDLDLSIFRYESGLSEIGEFVDNNRIELFKNFYKYLTPETREKLIKVFKLYEKECVDINISAIIELMMNAVYDFPNLQNIVFEDLVSKLKTPENDTVKVYPDPKSTALANLYVLKQLGYFKEKTLEKELGNVEKLKGIYPEIDWDLFNIKNESVISRLIENRTFAMAKEQFAKNEEEKKLFDDWAVKMFEKGSVKFKGDVVN